MHSNLYNSLANNIETTRALIKEIISNPFDYKDWSLQGFGMLRLYLTKEIRLHVWDARFAVPNVSLMHNHPWDFDSLVVSGYVVNKRFDYDDNGIAYNRVRIKCGPGGGQRSEPETVLLSNTRIDCVRIGETYHQLAHELHESHPGVGTVTLIERVFKSDTEHAEVLYPALPGAVWVSAEPRPATSDEINTICGEALRRWDWHEQLPDCSCRRDNAVNCACRS